MPDAHETLSHALNLHARSIDRLSELEVAMANLSDGAGPGPSLTCSLTVTREKSILDNQKGWTVTIGTTAAFLRPLFAAELLKERDNEARMRRKLEAARSAMQAAP